MMTAEERRINFYGHDDARAYDHDELYLMREYAKDYHENSSLNIDNSSGSLLKDWQMWEDCILSFLRTHKGLRAKFNEHVNAWNTQTKLPPSAHER